MLRTQKLTNPSLLNLFPFEFGFDYVNVNLDVAPTMPMVNPSKIF